MSELFKYAISNWMGSTLVNGASDLVSVASSQVTKTNPLVGQTVELDKRKIRIEKVIAEGGFGYVFLVRDSDGRGNQYALKRLIAADSAARQDIENEVSILRELQPHPHIMRLISYGVISGNIHLILTEYCCNGSLSSFKLPIEKTSTINKIIYQTALALKHLHSKGITHRDIKIENILFDASGIVKLCDFGSATKCSYSPDESWSAFERSKVEDEMQTKTTPMYRPPEILDTYYNYPIGPSMDIWSFGCIVYLLKFGRHPFEDSSKLRIINCNYNIPGDISRDDHHVTIIVGCLRVDPRERFTINDIITFLEDSTTGDNSSPATSIAEQLSENVCDTINEDICGESTENICETIDTPVDLLGGALPEVNSSSENCTKGSSTVDLLSEIFCGVSLASSSTTSNFSGLDAPRSTTGSLINNLKRNTSTPNLTKVDQPSSVKLDDPLADIVGPFLTSANTTSNSMNASRKLTGGQITSQVSGTRPLSPLKPLKPLEPLKPLPAMSSSKPGNVSTSVKSNGSTFRDHQFVAPKQPHYSRSFFKDAESLTSSSAAGSASAGVNPKVAPNQFEELLTGFTKSPQVDTSGMTIAQLRKADLLKTGQIDPLKMRVLDWKENKTRNIRALLGSLDTVIWPGCKWTPIGMHQLVEASDVKKAYHKACLAVHPDKLRGDENEELAKLIFVELNDAWSEFEKTS